MELDSVSITSTPILVNDHEEIKNSYRNQIMKPSLNAIGEEKYNIPKIIEHLSCLSGKEIIYEVCKLLKEKKVFLENIYKFLIRDL
jgi:hypothetical protein